MPGKQWGSADKKINDVQMKAMILAAGLGTRLKPWTDHHPKCLAVVNGKTLLQRNIEYLQGHGITEVIVNVHHFAQQVTDAIKEHKGWGSNISISDETDEVLETGGGLKRAAWYLEKDTEFILMNADILTNMDLTKMIGLHKALRPLATLAVSNRASSRYFLFDAMGHLTGWKNEKTGEVKMVRAINDIYPKAFSGIHVIDSSIFSLMKRTGKFSMVDVYLDLAMQYNIHEFDHTGSLFIDVGKAGSIEIAQTDFK
ncbi:MAG: nucleotidyltransferase family protein [Chitinophagaceae bacterium]|nr:nucleotidyltransferase family protein [Chitinophagaceae bacterium]